LPRNYFRVTTPAHLNENNKLYNKHGEEPVCEAVCKRVKRERERKREAIGGEKGN